MALRIRLRRMGRRNAPTYRIVVAESSMPRDGRIVENIGHYNPRTEPVTLSVDRAKALSWIERGATPSETVKALMKKAGIFRPEETVVESAAAAVTDTAKKAAQGAKDVAAKATDAVKDAAEAVTGGGEETPAEEAPAAEAAAAPAAEPQAEAEPQDK